MLVQNIDLTQASAILNPNLYEYVCRSRHIQEHAIINDAITCHVQVWQHYTIYNILAVTLVLFILIPVSISNVKDPSSLEFSKYVAHAWFIVKGEWNIKTYTISFRTIYRNVFTSTNQRNVFTSTNHKNVFTSTNHKNLFTSTNHKNVFTSTNQRNVFSVITQMLLVWYVLFQTNLKHTNSLFGNMPLLNLSWLKTIVCDSCKSKLLKQYKIIVIYTLLQIKD